MAISLPQVAEHYGLTVHHPKTIKNICGVSLSTAKRWRESGNWPLWAIKLLCLHHGYFVWEDWEGWSIQGGALFSPELRKGFTPADIHSIHFLRQRCDHLERLNSAPAQYLLGL